ncbi:aromatic ring-hydroxylating dioxygenase subunit alpha [uncultured Sneathiella sp.]|uniref:aromatic ring-hydroxylating dioxygenase subunit alpha n=1 Tax=uncultured Sneathiella sp. TaxID=879315 RepID=UPI0030EC7C49
MLAKDHWYIACPSSQLSAHEPKAVTIGDQAIVVYRAKDGKPAALQDRCCHRGVKLSKGRVLENGCIACGYHGWEYDADGIVKHIPSVGSNGRLPSYKISSFHAVESQHYIWVWIAGEHEAPTYKPFIDGLESGSWVQQTKIWQCNVMSAVENQLDISHTAFSHPGNYPTHKTSAGEMPRLKERAWRTRIFDGCRVAIYEKRGRNIEIPPTLENPDTGLGLFEMPFRNYVFLPSERMKAIYSWIPLSDSSCRLEFIGQGLEGGGSPDGDELSVAFMEGEFELLSQDRILLESAQDTFAQEREMHVIADRPQLAGRQIMQHALGLREEKPKDQEIDLNAFA